jgi:hypothetical protein
MPPSDVSLYIHQVPAHAPHLPHAAPGAGHRGLSAREQRSEAGCTAVCGRPLQVRMLGGLLKSFLHLEQEWGHSICRKNGVEDAERFAAALSPPVGRGVA